MWLYLRWQAFLELQVDHPNWSDPKVNSSMFTEDKGSMHIHTKRERKNRSERVVILWKSNLCKITTGYFAISKLWKYFNRYKPKHVSESHHVFRLNREQASRWITLSRIYKITNMKYYDLHSVVTCLCHKNARVAQERSE